ncbi:MAG: hypothetical protein IKX35_03280 [Bacteroidales bacterium]|nr:hypothetical protein [Bacteroidales bacterium]
MKKISTIVMALLMVLTLSQCKKNEQNTSDNQDKAVIITLDVKGGNGSRVVVNPNTGTVDFENNDQIIVASGGKYVGTLTYNGTLFTGAISNATEGYPLQFYFLGNVTPAETLTSGVTESCSVVISDQTEHLPVISAAPSDENYTASTMDYTAHLLNKCALVKFNVTTASEAAICVIGFNNKVTVDFMENAFTYSKTGGGYINLGAGNGEKWAILLPQEALEVGEAGSAYSEDGVYTGIRGAVPAITENGYLTTGIAVMVNTLEGEEVPVGAINGKFTINYNGDQVYFSQGNLMYIKTTEEWSFMEHQYDRVYTHQTEFGEDYSNYDTVTLFGWGTSGYNHGSVCYQPWSTNWINDNKYYAYGQWNANLNDQTGMADWGYNAITNGGNQENQWRTLTRDEWTYIISDRTGFRFAKAMVNDVNGVILLPDGWNEAIYALNDANLGNAPYTTNVISLEDWGTLENYGAVFLPVTGYRHGGMSNDVWSNGYYWTASYSTSTHACINSFDSSAVWYSIGSSTIARHIGCAVRLVRDVH